MAILYTKNTSGAIRRLRRKKPTKEYLIALARHIKYLKKLGFVLILIFPIIILYHLSVIF